MEAANTVIALLALAFSAYTYWHTGRQLRNADIRQFLLESAHAADRLTAAIYVFHKYHDLQRFQEALEPVKKDFFALRQASARWQRETFYPDFEALLKALSAYGGAVEDFDVQTGPSDAGGMVDAMEELLEQSQKYAQRGRTVLASL